jgi:hypothetical protein
MILLYCGSKVHEFNNCALNVLNIFIIPVITELGRNHWFCFERRYCELNRTFGKTAC